MAPASAKAANEIIGVIDHQVAVERQAGDLAQAGHDGRPDGDVGHKVAVHDVDMDGGAAAALGRRNLVGQVGKVSGQYRRQKLNHRRIGRSSTMKIVENLLRGQCISPPAAQRTSEG